MRGLLPLIRLPIDRDHADDQFGVAHLVDQAIAHGPQLDLVAVLRAMEAGGGHLRVVQPFGQFLLELAAGVTSLLQRFS